MPTTSTANWPNTSIACQAGLRILNLDVRETQDRAIQVYEQLGFERWGSHPHYVEVGGRWLTGHYYYKVLAEEMQSQIHALSMNCLSPAEYDAD